ncbi:MAG: hypothetical protein ACYDA0_12520 [Candidatus Dormibacteraceae bacterium]
MSNVRDAAEIDRLVEAFIDACEAALAERLPVLATLSESCPGCR